MCDTCGCEKNDHFHVHPGPGHQHRGISNLKSQISNPHQHAHAHSHAHEHGHEHSHEHDHEHDHGHSHEHEHEHKHEHGHESGEGWHAHTAADGSVSWHRHGDHGAQQVLDANQREAERNRGFFRARGILALNLVSAPGSGKTTLLQATLERLQARVGCAVLVGDLETQADAEALRPSGAPVVQITTGTVCHLDARMVAAAVDTLPKEGVRLLFIENVGNLVCPASFDLGEAHRIVLLAATEGENKPLKYPPIFHGARAVVISKTDLAGPAGFDLARARQAIAQVAPEAEILELSSRNGDGLDEWVAFLERLVGAPGS
jgi:hydrogenase nickel incorporation protein HypB